MTFSIAGQHLKIDVSMGKTTVGNSTFFYSCHLTWFFLWMVATKNSRLLRYVLANNVLVL